jgi:hypothetical protein
MGNDNQKAVPYLRIHIKSKIKGEVIATKESLCHELPMQLFSNILFVQFSFGITLVT